MTTDGPDDRPVWPADAATTWARRVLRLTSRLVPFRRRATWLAEWEAELWVMRRRKKQGVALLRYAFSSVSHGIWERREEGDGMLRVLIHDMRLAGRRLARTPGFTAITIGILGLGIGANAALFGALESTLLRTPAYPDPDRIVTVDLLFESRAGEPADTMGWSYPKFELAREALTSVQSFSGYNLSTVTLSGDGPATRLNVEFVTPGYFDLLGVQPLQGRLFTAAEEAPADAPALILSHRLWSQRFGADPDILGRTLTLDGVSMEVVGVLPPSRRGVTGAADLWVPMAGITALRGPRRLQLAWAHWLYGLARLSPGVSIEQAREEAATTGLALTEAYPDPDGGGAHGVTVTPFLAARVNPVARAAVLIVSLAAGLFLLIACGNVAGLLLARGAGRRGDTAVRSALGAGRARLLGEHLAESVVLGIAGGLLGLLLAWSGQAAVASAVRYALDTAGTRGISYIDPDTIRLGGGTLVIGICAALLTSIVFGLLPALQASTVSPGDELRRAGGATLGRGRSSGLVHARSAMVGLQIVLTLVLLTGATLMASSFARLSGLESGYMHPDVLTLAYDRGPGATDDEHHAFVDEVVGRLGALAGIEAASLVTCPPLAGRCEITGVRQVDDGPQADDSEMPGVLAYSAGDAYFDAIGIPIVEGRTFSPEDRDGPPVVVINQTAAREIFGVQSAIGRRISITHSLTEVEMATVVGIVGDVRYGDLEEEAMPAVYLSEHQVAMPYGTLVVRTTDDPRQVLPAVRALVAEVDADLPLFDVTTMAERRFAATARTRVILALLAAFGLAGLLLSAIGLYGLVSQGVASRSREVGLRIALGADRVTVLRMLTAGPALLVAGSLLIGIALAGWASSYLSTLLFDTSARSPLALTFAAVVLGTVTLAAAIVPASRATRLTPTQTLRQE